MLRAWAIAQMRGCQMQDIGDFPTHENNDLYGLWRDQSVVEHLKILQGLLLYVVRPTVEKDATFKAFISEHDHLRDAWQKVNEIKRKE